MILLADFKKIDFFSLNDFYPIEESKNRASNSISISITDEKSGIKKIVFSSINRLNIINNLREKWRKIFMMFDSVIIKLIRKGAGDDPKYSLTITGDGNIVYEGKENVKIKGKRTEHINEKNIMILLADFKKIDFFSLNDFYPIEESKKSCFK